MIETYAEENYPKYKTEMNKIIRCVGEEKTYDDIIEEVIKLIHNKNKKLIIY